MNNSVLHSNKRTPRAFLLSMQIKYPQLDISVTAPALLQYMKAAGPDDRLCRIASNSYARKKLPQL